MVYGQSRAYAGQLKKGQSYDALRPTTSIWLCGEDVFPELGAMLRFRIREAQGKVLEEGWRIELLQLAKWFTEREALLAERFAPWYAFFNEAETWTEVPPHLARPELEKAMHVLDDFQKDPDLDQIYRGRLELERIRLTEQERLAEAIRAREEAERGRETEARAREEAERRGDSEARAREEAERGRETEARAREEAERGRDAEARAREAEARAREEAERATVAALAEIERLRAELRDLDER
jgi:PD-(D/E)XK nuclease family transposase